MMVANSFDLWQKDTFFSAAEEVQESADIMESAYRMWERERREGQSPEDLDQLSKDLQTTLGTAKWQLEEFERAVRMSYAYHSEDNTTARHRQFIEAIEHQISRVEAALREAFSEEGKQPLRWVNLDEEERDDLAMFLSGSFQSTPSREDECIPSRPTKSGLLENHSKRIDRDSSSNTTSTRDVSDEIKDCRDVGTTIAKSTDCIIDIEETGTPGTSDEIICQPERTGTRRTWSSPNYSALRIMIPDEQSNKLITNIEATPKEKGFKAIFGKQMCREHPQTNRVVIFLNQLLCRFGGFQRQLQSPMHFQFSCSFRLMLALLLTIFLAVHFVLYLA